MLCGNKLPPSGRDFEVFEAVTLGGRTTRETATQFKLSQTRICQIVERLREWQAEVLPQESPLSEAQRSRYAKVVAAGRLDHLYGEMMEAWRRSQGEVKKTRSARFGDEVTTTTTSCGDPKYLLAAMRLATAQAELGVGTGLCYPVDEMEETGSVASAHHDRKNTADENPVCHEVSGRPEARPTNHPERDCSENRQSQPTAASPVAKSAAATGHDERVSAALTPRQVIARQQLFAPVQGADLVGERGCATQVELTPERLGLSVQEILSKQQRRDLKRARRAG